MSNASIVYTLLGLVCRSHSKADHISTASNYRAESLSWLKESGRSAADSFIGLFPPNLGHLNNLSYVLIMLTYFFLGSPESNMSFFMYREGVSHSG